MADTRQFTDHNEIGGVNVYLEDKKLAESPEKNTVESTDYVLLKNTEGVPQKISKANLMGVVKDALADLLKSNDLGTSVTNVPALNASAFGSATVANLASVLGIHFVENSILWGDAIQHGAYGVYIFKKGISGWTTEVPVVAIVGNTLGWFTHYMNGKIIEAFVYWNRSEWAIKDRQTTP